jgi:nucleotide-binding universal stress UspA family protein
MTGSNTDSPGTPGPIIAGIDGSPASLEALRWAARQAGFTGCTVEVVLAWDWPTSLGWSMPIPEDFDPEASARTVLDEAITSLHVDFPALAVEGRVEPGHPAPILVKASKGASLLVVASRGHGEFAGMLLGSVSEYCATHAHCPVLVYRTDT